jgi:hypothetical protein
MIGARSAQRGRSIRYAALCLTLLLAGCARPAEMIAQRARDLLHESGSNEMATSAGALLEMQDILCVILGPNDRPVAQKALKTTSNIFVLSLQPDPIDVNIIAFGSDGSVSWHHTLHRQDRDLGIITKTREDSDVCLSRDDIIQILKVDDNSIVIVVDDRI